MVGASHEDVGRLGRDDDFQRPRRHHHEWHARRMAECMINEVALATFGLVRDAVLEDLLIFRRERGLLAESPWLGLVERWLPAEPAYHKARPGAAQVRIHRRIGRLHAD